MTERDAAWKCLKKVIAYHNRVDREFALQEWVRLQIEVDQIIQQYDTI
jgi:hypothetical protein